MRTRVTALASRVTALASRVTALASRVTALKAVLSPYKPLRCAGEPYRVTKVTALAGYNRVHCLELLLDGYKGAPPGGYAVAPLYFVPRVLSPSSPWSSTSTRATTCYEMFGVRVYQRAGCPLQDSPRRGRSDEKKRQ